MEFSVAEINFICIVKGENRKDMCLSSRKCIKRARKSA